ncbi:MAG: peptidoglycan DD-metalloendopeptidase family protein [Planctomycetes bacterium]|nr:peptidoglycan DD-metalloendopeptidase family protein [Planctomycetota bacterium]
MRNLVSLPAGVRVLGALCGDKPRCGLALAALLVAWPAASRADVVETAGGERLEGEGLEFLEDGLRLAGRRLRWEEVALVRQTPETGLEAYEARAAALDPGDAAGWFELGEWCRDRGLSDPAQGCFERAVAARPDHEGARGGLGQVLQDGAWVDAKPLFEGRARAVKEGDKEGWRRVARWAADHRLDRYEYLSLRNLLAVDAFDTRGLKAIRPYTDRVRTGLAPIVPLEGDWHLTVDRTLHHQKKVYAVYAYDIVRLDGTGKPCAGEGRRNEDYLAWDQPVLAAADGEVVAAESHHDDNTPGRVGAFDQSNVLLIDHGHDVYTLYHHLKKGSLAVKLRDRVRTGQVVARVGNSGASGMPHLHFCVVEGRVGVSVPFWFRDFALVVEGGREVRVERGRPPEGSTVRSLWRPSEEGEPGGAGGGDGAREVRGAEWVPTGGEGLGGEVDRALARAAGFLAARQLEGGPWAHYQTAEVVPGAGVSALVLAALAEAPFEARRVAEGALERGAAWLDKRLEGGAVTDPLHPIGYRKYATALTARAFRALGGEPWTSRLASMRHYLIQSQLDEGEGLPPFDWQYGAWNYYENDRRETRRVDVSVAAYVLDALWRLEVPADDAVWARARRFLDATRNPADAAHEALDGGFAFSPRLSKAGQVRVEGRGAIHRSYGSATADGLRALLACGAPPDDPARREALGWIAAHFRLDANPGFPEEDRTGWGAATRYYWLAALAESLRGCLPEGRLAAPSGERDWASEVAGALLESQQEDGSWRGGSNLMGEHHPEVATALAMLALEACLPGLE